VDFELRILGANSAVPAHGRFMTSQFLNIQQHYFLIDCAEGTQMRLQEFNCRPQRIEHIFISHLHGDHVFGLVGLLLSLGLNHRTEELNIYAPKGLEEMIEVQLKMTASHLNYPLVFHTTDPSQSQRLLDLAELTVDSIPLRHRVPTHGFLFREKEGESRMRKDKIKEYGLSVQEIKAAKAGEDIKLEDGRLIPNSELTLSPPKARSYAFCSDTAYDESIIPLIEGVDLLYHEATFMHELLDQAMITKHSTTLQAAQIAQKARVGELIIGHFSSRYADLEPLLEEAQSVFPKTKLAIDGHLFSIPYDAVRSRD
jgi:ribonuclease Z